MVCPPITMQLKLRTGSTWSLSFLFVLYVCLFVCFVPFIVLQNRDFPSLRRTYTKTLYGLHSCYLDPSDQRTSAEEHSLPRYRMIYPRTLPYRETLYSLEPLRYRYHFSGLFLSTAVGPLPLQQLRALLMIITSPFLYLSNVLTTAFT